MQAVFQTFREGTEDFAGSGSTKEALGIVPGQGEGSEFAVVVCRSSTPIKAEPLNFPFPTLA